MMARALAIMGLLLVLPGLAFPAFTRIFVDEFLLASHYNWESNFIMAIFVTMVFAGILTSLPLVVKWDSPTILVAGICMS